MARAERCRLAGRNNHYGNEQGISQDKPLQVVPAYHLEYTLMHHDGKNFDWDIPFQLRFNLKLLLSC